MTTHPIRHNAATWLACFVLLPFAVGQQSGQPGGGRGGSNNPPGGNAPTQPSVRPPSEPQRQPQMPRVLFFHGRVVQENGAPIPMGAFVESSCNGRTKTVATVDLHGFFSFQMGGMNESGSIIPQASDDSPVFDSPGGFGNRDETSMGRLSATGSSSLLSLNGCELRVRLSGYRSSAVILQGPFDVGQIDVGTILLSLAERVSGTTVSMTDLRAPKQAQKSLQRARKAIQKKNLDEAEKDLNAAVELYPNYAAAWFTLGRLYQQTQRNEEARKAYTAAVAADKNYVNPYIGLAQLAGVERKWQEVADVTDRAIELDPLDYPEGYYYNSIANYNLNKLDVAEKSALKAQRLDGMHRYPLVHLILANMLERRQDAPGAVEQLEKYLQFAPNAADAEQVRARLESLKKSKLLADKQPPKQ